MKFKPLPYTKPEDIFSVEEQDEILLSLEYLTEYFPDIPNQATGGEDD